VLALCVILQLVHHPRSQGKMGKAEPKRKVVGVSDDSSEDEEKPLFQTVQHRQVGLLLLLLLLLYAAVLSIS
jgi:hypothetical protein